MKVVERTGDRLTLQGVPFVGFSPLSVIVLTSLTAGCGLFLYHELSASKWQFTVLAVMLAGVLAIILCVVLFFAGKMFQRERLVIDKAVHTVSYERWWLMGVGRMRREVELARVAGVSLERSTTRHPGRRGGTIIIESTRLLLDEPRDAIVLASSETGSRKHVRPTATEVAEFLGVDISRLGKLDRGRSITPARSANS